MADFYNGVQQGNSGSGGGSGGGVNLSQVDHQIRTLVPQWARQPALEESAIPQSIFRDAELTNELVRRVLNLTQSDLNNLFTDAEITNGNLVFTRLDDTEVSLPLATGTPNAAVGTLSDPQLVGTVLSFAVAGSTSRTEIDLAALAGSVANEEGLIFVLDADVTYPTASSFNDIRLSVTGAAATYGEGDGYRFFAEGVNTGALRLRVGNAAYAPVLRKDLTAFVGAELTLHDLVEVTYNPDLSSWISNIDPPSTSVPVTPTVKPTEHTIRYGLLDRSRTTLADIRSGTLLSPPNRINLEFPAPTEENPYWFVEIPQGLTFSRMVNLAVHESDETADWPSRSGITNDTPNSQVRVFLGTIIRVTGLYRLEVTI